jgi:acetyltransferase-like isoleucine patch superfamily enzyme
MTSAVLNNQLPDYQRIAPDVKLGRDVRIYVFVNLYGCEIGDETKIGTFVEIQKGAKIGENAIVEAGSVVTKNVPPDTTVAGNPARVLKRFLK